MNSSSLTVHQNDYEVSTASVVSESHRVSAWLLIDVNATLTCCDFCSMITYLSLSGSRHTFLSSLWGPLPSACWCSERCLQPFSHSVMVPTQPCLLPMLSTDGFSWEVPTATCELSCSLGALSKEKMSQLGKPGPGFLTRWLSQQPHVTTLDCSFEPGRLPWTLCPGFSLQISSKDMQCPWQMLRGQHQNPPFWATTDIPHWSCSWDRFIWPSRYSLTSGLRHMEAVLIGRTHDRFRGSLPRAYHGPALTTHPTL